MCISDGVLRAKIDGELPERELEEARAHLAGCAGCRAREEEIAGRAARVSALFSELAPGPEPDTAAGLARLRARRGEGAAERPSLAVRLFPARLTPAWGLVTALALAAVLAWPPARAVAQRLLGILRIQAVVAVPIERDFAAERKGQMLSQIFAGTVVTTKESKQLNVASREEAAKMAGFDLRLPEMRSDAPQITVHTAQAFHFRLDPQRLATLASALDRPDLAVPAGLEGAQVFVDAPAGVMARYGECPVLEPHRQPPPGLHYETCLNVVEGPTPTVVTQPDFDLRAVAEFGLQLTGMNAEQARTFSQAIDWSSTVAIPIPRSASSYQTVEVDGAKGVLVTGVPSGAHNLPPGYALFWVRNGMMYSLSGFGDPGMAVPLAQSLR